MNIIETWNKMKDGQRMERMHSELGPSAIEKEGCLKDKIRGLAGDESLLANDWEIVKKKPQMMIATGVKFVLVPEETEKGFGACSHEGLFTNSFLLGKTFTKITFEWEE